MNFFGFRGFRSEKWLMEGDFAGGIGSIGELLRSAVLPGGWILRGLHRAGMDARGCDFFRLFSRHAKTPGPDGTVLSGLPECGSGAPQAGECRQPSYAKATADRQAADTHRPGGSFCLQTVPFTPGLKSHPMPGLRCRLEGRLSFFCEIRSGFDKFPLRRRLAATQG